MSSEEHLENSFIPSVDPTLIFDLGVERPKRTVATKAQPTKPILPFGLELPKKRRATGKQTAPTTASKKRRTHSGSSLLKWDEEPQDEDPEAGSACGSEQEDGDVEEVPNDHANATAKPDQSQSHDNDDGADIVIEMPATCHDEFKRASAVEMAARSDAARLEAEGSQEKAPAASSNLIAASGECARASSSAGTFFNRDLGIKGLKVVTRKGMICLHCEQPFSKGDMRFQFAFSEKRPERSIHTGCLTQIPQTSVEPSVSVLKGLLQSSNLDHVQRQACLDALNVLQPRAGTGQGIGAGQSVRAV